VLSAERLAAQLAAWEEPGADKNPEHYRAATLKAYLDARSMLGEAELDGLLAIHRSEAEGPLAQHVPRELVHRELLDDAQLERVATWLGAPRFQALVERHRQFRRLRVAPESCYASDDAQVQECLLALADVPRPVVERLAEHGANQRVRHLATSRLRR
jgi:hypothetical protein